jgi:hypothetical protein
MHADTKDGGTIVHRKRRNGLPFMALVEYEAYRNNQHEALVSG